MSERITLKSGRVILIGMAPFSIGTRLFKTIANELKTVDVDIPTLDLKTVKDTDVNALKNAVFQLIGSDALEAVVFDCFARCTLDGAKITRETFEKPEARPDYLPAAWEVIKFNLLPFFQGLDLSSLTSAKQNAPAQP